MNLKNEKIYIHRERGFVVIPKKEAKKIAEQLSKGGLMISEFEFSWRKFKGDELSSRSDFSASPVYVYWKGKPLGRMNWRTGKISFDTKVGLIKRARELESCFLQGKIINKPFNIKHSYVEICTRFPREFYSLALEKMKLVKKTFRTEYTHCHIKDHDSIEKPYLYLVKNLIFNQYKLNLKVYLALEFKNGKYSPDKIIGEDFSREPKIEVQISKINNLETAKKEAIPVILAFLESIGANTLEMIEDDYELVGFSDKYLKSYQQILAHFSFKQAQFNLFFCEKKVNEIIGLRRLNILEKIVREPLNKKEIKDLFEISKNTIESDLAILIKHKLVYSRGRDGISKMYAFNWEGCRNNRPPETLPE